MGTANHYLLDAAAGVAVMGLGFVLAQPALRVVDALRVRVVGAMRPAGDDAGGGRRGGRDATVTGPRSTATRWRTTRPARTGGPRGAATRTTRRTRALLTALRRRRRGRKMRAATGGSASDAARTSRGRRRGTRTRWTPAQRTVVRVPALRVALCTPCGNGWPRCAPPPAPPLDARALAALAANPGCRRRAVLDAAGVDKGALAGRLGSPAPFGQSRSPSRAATPSRPGSWRTAAPTCCGCSAPPRRTGDGAPVGRGPRPVRAGTEGRVGPHAGWPSPRPRPARLDPAGPPPCSRSRSPGSTAYLEPDAVAVGPDGPGRSSRSSPSRSWTAAPTR